MCVLCSQLHAAAQDSIAGTGIAVDDVVSLLQAGSAEDSLIARITAKKAAFDLTSATTARLVRAGASDALLDAIRDNTLPNPCILHPAHGQRCSTRVHVRGHARTAPGRYLWLFARPADAENWWPQGHAVAVSDTNTWQAKLRTAHHGDTATAYDIAAVWVDEKLHRLLTDYAVQGGKTGHFPGIPLPEDAPRHTVRVLVHGM
jgi:hypothetical protein